MLYKPWTPFGDMLGMQKEMANLMKWAFGPMEKGAFLTGKIAWAPPIESFYKGKDLIVRVWIPGVEAPEVDVQVSGNLLLIKGERKMTHEVPEDQYLFSEVVYGPFERTVTLPEGLKFEQVKAKYTFGVLEITLPIHEGVLPKKVPIEVTPTPKPVLTGTR